MSRIYEHKKMGFMVKYRVYFPDGSFLDKYKYAKSRKEAVLELNNIEKLETLSQTGKLTKEQIVFAINKKYIKHHEGLALAQSSTLKPITLNDIYPLYREYASKRWNYNTQKSFFCTTENMLTHIGHEIIDDPQRFLKITNEYIDSLQVSNRTKNIYIDRISQMINIAITNNMLPFHHNPIKERYPEKAVRFPPALSYEQVKEVLSIAKRSPCLFGHAYIITIIFIYCGLRKAELQYLTWDDVKSDRILIQPKEILPHERTEPLRENIWQPKTNSSRAIYIENPKWHTHVLQPLQRLAKKGRFVFTGNKAMNKYALQSAYNMRMLHNQPFSLHSLRHTFITWRIEQRDPLPRVMSLAGHANIETTMRYTHIALTNQKDILTLLTKVNTK